MMLRLLVPHMKGESPAGFCSRLALRNACDSFRHFCHLLGLRFQGIVDGDENSLRTLGELSGTHVDLLTAAAIRKVDSTRFSLNGQIILKPMLRRSSVRICPHCLQDDLDSHPDLGPLAIWQRTEWLLSTFRRCPVHGVALVTAAQSHPKHVHDFHLAVLSRLGNLPEWKDAAGALPPSRFEDHVRQRLLGVAESVVGWLSVFPLYATTKLCEAVGILALYGRKARRETISEADMHSACDRGYAILNAGPNSIAPWVDGLLEPYCMSNRGQGPRAIFGGLYNWLSYREQPDPVYDPVREIVRERLLCRFPFEPGEDLMGRPVESRWVWSIHSAIKATGRHRKPLRKLLAADGLIPTESGKRSDNRILFQADEVAAEFLRKMTGAMLLNQVGRYIGAPRTQMQILVKEGFLTPFRENRSNNIHRRLFAKSDADKFLERLQATMEDGDLDEFADIPTAVKRSATSAAFILRLLLDRKLKTVRRNPAAHGYLSVMVDPDEVQQHSHVDTGQPISARQAGKLTHWSDHVIKALVSRGHLEGTIASRCGTCQ